MTDHLIETCFATRGLLSRSSGPALDCPSDETFAGYASALLPARDRQTLEGHALRCADCHELLQAIAAAVGIARPAAVRVALVPSVRVVARLLERGMQLVNRLELGLLELVAPPPVPALGGLRRAGASTEPADLLRIRGPGHGLDALELQLQADGTVRVIASGALPAERRAGEILSFVLEWNGEEREQRPFEGRAVHFAPLGAGRYRVRLVGRIPGESARELARAELEVER